MNSSDLVISVLGSTIFWVTAAGIAFRALRLDFRQLEAFLESTYNRVDKFTFSVSSTARFVAERLLSSIYGLNHSRVLLVTAVTCLSINTFAVIKMKFDWINDRISIEQKIDTAIEHISPNYHSLTYTEDGRAALMKAFDQTVIGGGQGAIVYFTNTDPQSVKIRELYDRFHDQYDDYIYRNNFYYADTLELTFGTPHSDPFLIRQHKSDIVFSYLLLIALNIALDWAAVYATINSFKAILLHAFARFCLWSSMIIACFVASYLVYQGLLRGQGLFVVMQPIVCGSLLFFLFRILYSVLSAVEGIRWKICAIVVFSGLAFWGHALIFGFFLFFWEVFTRMLFAMYVVSLSQGGNLLSIISSMPALYPAIALVSVLLWISVGKVLFVVLKQLILGQIYGASVMSGGTFFIGFITTIITSTAVIWSLWSIVGAVPRSSP